jgi:hypothetical protein
VQDEDVPVDDDGTYTIVVSRPDARPANATAECGVAWLPADPSGDTVLAYRHMLPDVSFRQAIQNIRPGTEEQTMGDYYPRGTYYDTAAGFERLGCQRRPDATGRQPDGSESSNRGTLLAAIALTVGVAGLALVLARWHRTRVTH